MRAESKAWLGRIGAGLYDPATVGSLLDGSSTRAELRAVLRSQIADRLHDAARKIGRRAAVEGATIVAICPHPAWEGVVAGLRALLVIRQVAALFGMRPGLAVTLTLVSQGLADEVLSTIPGVKNVSSALGAGTVAIRIYRLATITAQACSSV